jgi:hypothetical protein
MAITVKHSKVSAIPDGDDSSVVRPSDWNDDHVLTGTIPVANGGTGAATLTGYVKGTGTTAMTASTTIPSTDVTGLGTMSTQNSNNISVTGGTMSGVAITGYIPTTEKAQPLGVATLDAGGKVPQSQIPLMGDLNYQGTWNASTNTPTLTSSVGTKGYYYVVDVSGNTNLNGITDWVIGDWAIFNGSVWQKVDNTDAVTSVNGLVGTVVLTTTNIAEGTNLYYTDVRARASNSAGTGISYDAITGVITNSSPSLGGDVVGPVSATDNAIARFDTTTGKLIQNSVVTVSDTGAIAGATTITNLNYLDFDTTYATTLGAGQLGWNGNDTLGLGMIGGNVVQHIGEDVFFYVKASATITKGQLCMFTGAVGSSGVLTAAPSTAIPFAEAIIGVAAENIANNGFGLIQGVGTLSGVDTSAFLDGDILYYNSAVTGGFTKTYPASGPVVIAAAVAKSGSGGSGVLTVRISFQTRVTGSTGISVVQGNDTVVVTNTAPDQTVSISGGTGISTSGTYPSFTVTNTAPDQTVAIASGTGISVTGTYPNFTVANTAPSSGGTVTSVAALTIGTTGTDLSSTVANGTTTPVITLQVPTASATNRGALSSTDWSTFNGKANAFTYTTNYIPYGQGTTTPTQSANLTFNGTTLTTTDITDSSLTAGRVTYAGTGGNLVDSSTFTFASSTLTAPIVSASNGLVVNSNTVSANYTIPSGSSASSVGPMTVSSGIVVTVSSGSRWVVL